MPLGSTHSASTASITGMVMWIRGAPASVSRQTVTLWSRAPVTTCLPSAENPMPRTADEWLSMLYLSLQRQPRHVFVSTCGKHGMVRRAIGAGRHGIA
jgi:hypothetical protein